MDWSSGKNDRFLPPSLMGTLTPTPSITILTPAVRLRHTAWTIWSTQTVHGEVAKETEEQAGRGALRSSLNQKSPVSTSPLYSLVAFLAAESAEVKQETSICGQSSREHKGSSGVAEHSHFYCMNKMFYPRENNMTTFIKIQQNQTAKTPQKRII